MEKRIAFRRYVTGLFCMIFCVSYAHDTVVAPQYLKIPVARNTHVQVTLTPKKQFYTIPNYTMELVVYSVCSPDGEMIEEEAFLLQTEPEFQEDIEPEWYAGDFWVTKEVVIECDRKRGNRNGYYAVFVRKVGSTHTFMNISDFFDSGALVIKKGHSGDRGNVRIWAYISTQASVYGKTH